MLFFIDDEEIFLFGLSIVMIFLGVCTFFSLTFGKQMAPYGRYVDAASWFYGFKMNGKLAWILQEAPAFFIPIICLFYAKSECLNSITNCILLCLFLFHYFHRAFIFPFLIKGGKPTPFIVFLLALLFCLINGYLQGRYLTKFMVYSSEWLTSVPFIAGVTLFFTGLAINIHSDAVLRNLRKPGETGYKIPHGGMFHYVSGANFFGEILEWTGFAIACSSLPSLAFAFFTFTNIGPRGIQHHQWYCSKFEDYPKNRKGVIPFLW